MERIENLQMVAKGKFIRNLFLKSIIADLQVMSIIKGNLLRFHYQGARNDILILPNPL